MPGIDLVRKKPRRGGRGNLDRHSRGDLSLLQAGWGLESQCGGHSFPDLAVGAGAQLGLPIRASTLSLLLWPGLPHSMAASWLLDSDTVTQGPKI